MTQQNINGKIKNKKKEERKQNNLHNELKDEDTLKIAIIILHV